MAGNDTIQAVSRTLRGCFPVWSRELTVEATQAWATFLRQYPDRIILAAATRLIERHKGPHVTIADFREHLREVREDAQFDAPRIEGPKPDAISLDEFLAKRPEFAEKAALVRPMIEPPHE